MLAHQVLYAVPQDLLDNMIDDTIKLSEIKIYTSIQTRYLLIQANLIMRHKAHLETAYIEAAANQ